MTDRTLALHCFASLPGCGPKALQALLDRDPVHLWFQATEADFLDFIPRGGKSVYQTYTQYNPSTFWQQEQAYFEKHDIWAITPKNEAYPESLGQLDVPPALLYGRGQIPDLRHSLSVIGTRKYSSYGKRICSQLISELAEGGMTIISGLALGIDSIAHQACLDGGGVTLGILGGGLDDSVLYPKQNRQLVEHMIAQGGGVISEFPPLTQPRKEYFPIRNRLVAGISSGILVIEAPEKSGTLITVNYGLEQNKDIFAVPGNIDQKTSSGTNYLLKQGAYVVTQAQDIFEVYGVDVELEATSLASFSQEQQEIVSLLQDQPCNVEVLSDHLQQDVADILTPLSLLELEGVITQDRQGVYQLKVRIVE